MSKENHTNRAESLDSFRLLERRDIYRARTPERMGQFYKELPDILFEELQALNALADLERQHAEAVKKAKAFAVPELESKAALLAGDSNALREWRNLLTENERARLDASEKYNKEVSRLASEIESTAVSVAAIQTRRDDFILSPCKLADGKIYYQGASYCAEKLPRGWIPPYLKLAEIKGSKETRFQLVMAK